jgi:hypothetical protein
VWSPAAREAAAVRRWRGWCGAVFSFGRERGREGSGESRSERVDRGEGKGWFTLGKGIFFEDALFPLTPLRLRLSAKSVKIGASDDFLRTSEARSLQRFSQSFRKIVFQRVNFYSF